jgi:two-component system chemotaxis response regulator CheY
MRVAADRYSLLPTQWRSPFRYFYLYRSPEASAGSGKTAPSVREGPILVVEDDPAILSTVADILEFEGYDVERAMNGVEALDVVERVRPRLVLLDMRMPVLDGWGFARTLDDRGIELPIIVMTAAQDARRWAQEIGAEGYVAKPFELTDLLAAIEGLLGYS